VGKIAEISRDLAVYFYRQCFPRLDETVFVERLRTAIEILTVSPGFAMPPMFVDE